MGALFRFRRFTPKILIKTIFEIPLENLVDQGFKVIAFDLDNTLTAWRDPEISEETYQWFKGLADHGITACILSNNNDERVKIVAEKLGIPYIPRARKPFKVGFRKLLKLLEIAPNETVMVGDQLFTDIWGANRAGIYTILIDPVSKKEFWGTRNISRRLERLIWAHIKRNIQENS